MPKSKKEWRRISGRVGPAWNGDIEQLKKLHKPPRGFRFHDLEWLGKKFTFIYVKD